MCGHFLQRRLHLETISLCVIHPGTPSVPLRVKTVPANVCGYRDCNRQRTTESSTFLGTLACETLQGGFFRPNLCRLSKFLDQEKSGREIGGPKLPDVIDYISRCTSKCAILSTSRTVISRRWSEPHRKVYNVRILVCRLSHIHSKL
jgi:hypothetical protein